MKCFSPISDLVIHSFSFQPIDSRMYVILSKENTEKAVIIDPCISEEALGVLKTNNVSKLIVILSHEHFDHISGVNWLRTLFDCSVLANTVCSKAIQDPVENRSKYFPVLFLMKSPEIQKQIQDLNIQPYSCYSDIAFEKRIEFDFYYHHFILETKPGHSDGSVCIILDNKCIFTGDSLLRTIPILRKPEGNKAKYFQETEPWLMSLDKNMLVFPGHGDYGKITEMYIYQQGNKK